MIETSEIRLVVLEELADLAPEYAGRIRDTDRLLADLKLTGDDASIFALQVAKRLGLAVPPREWRTVSTVADAIDLLATHAPSPRQGYLRDR